MYDSTGEVADQFADQQRFRSSLFASLRPLLAPQAIMAQTARLLGEYLHASRVFYSEVEPNGEFVVVTHDYTDGVASFAGRYRLTDFGRGVVRGARPGDTLTSADVANDERIGLLSRETYAERSIGAYVAVPLIKDDRPAGFLVVHSAKARAWTPAEIALVEDAAELTWAATQQASAEAALATSEERLQLALDAGAMGTFVWYPDEDRGEPDARMLELFGLPLDGELSLSAALASMIHPDDGERYAAAVGAALDPHGDGELREEIRVITPDGSLRWIEIIARVSFDDRTRHPLRMAGMAADVTARHQVEDEIRESEARYRTLFDSIDEAFCVCEMVVDTEGKPVDMRFLEVNRRFEEQSGIVNGVGRLSGEFLPFLLQSRVQTYARVGLGGETLRFEDHVEEVDRWFDVYASPVEPIGGGRFVLVFNDITDRKRGAERERLARLRSEMLADVVASLEGSGSVDDCAWRLVEVLVPGVADFAAVEATERGEPHLVASRGRILPAHEVVPLTSSRGRTVQLLLGFDDPHQPPPLGTDRSFLRDLADRVGVILAAARVREEEHKIALGLQRALLPGAVLQHEEVAIAARYEAGSDVLEVGGDWYDTFELPDGRIALSVGDVVGHGLDAAAAMGRLRVALAAFAPYASSPGNLLSQLDAFAAGSNGAEFATACYATFHPPTGVLRFASAGHPPMLVVTRDGTSHWLQDGRSTPLFGQVDPARPDATCVLDPGATLIMYSDGLIERRGETITDGLNRLEQAAVALCNVSVEDVCDRLMEQLGVADKRDDDVVVLCLRRPEGERPTFRRTIDAVVTELAPMRRALRAWLADEGLDSFAGDLVLAVDEACSNSIEHAYVDGDVRRTVEIKIDRDDDGSLFVAVTDFGRWKPPAPSSDRGRGLRIIERLTTELARESSDAGTTIRFRLTEQRPALS